MLNYLQIDRHPQLIPSLCTISLFRLGGLDLSMLTVRVVLTMRRDSPPEGSFSYHLVDYH